MKDLFDIFRKKEKSELLYSFYEVMPGYGENGIILEFGNDGLNLKLKVLFDGENGEQDSKTVIFKTVSFYSVGAFPGVSGISGIGNFEFTLGTIIKTADSKLSEEWTNYWHKRRKCNSYIIFFGSENKVINIIAEDFEVE